MEIQELSTEEFKCPKCAVLESKLSDLRVQIELFSFNSENSGQLSSKYFIDKMRKILDEEDHNFRCRCNSDEFVREKQHKSITELTPKGDIESNWNQVIGNFGDMNLDVDLLHGIYAYGFESPSAIQQRIIMPTISGWDIIAKAKPETGRTTGIIIGILQRIDLKNPHCQALILTMTAEDAQKIQGIILNLAIYMEISCHVASDISGHDMTWNQILVGTPFDVHSMLLRRVVLPDSIKILLIDNADKLLDENFKNETLNVMTALAMATQVILMSTVTMSSDVSHEAQKFMRHPVYIIVKDDVKHTRNYKGVREFYLDVDDDDSKLGTLCDLYQKLDLKEAIVFCNTISQVDRLSQMMRERHYTVSAMHSQLHEEDREILLNEFGSGSLPILITTESEAPTLEQKDQLPIVINYDFPRNSKLYMQRIWFGRRFGGGGKAISFIMPKDKSNFQQVQVILGTEIQKLPNDLQDLDLS